jgi:hypothetical protein
VKPDWKRVVAALRGEYGSCAQIARKLGYRNPTYLNHVMRGEIADPRWSLGNSLLELYRKMVGPEIPVINEKSR